MNKCLETYINIDKNDILTIPVMSSGLLVCIITRQKEGENELKKCICVRLQTKTREKEELSDSR
jgi:hypothetical protein